MGPYFAGMYAAYHHSKIRSDLSRSIEWLAFTIMLTIGFFGTNLPETWHAVTFKFIYYCMHKILFGWCAAYLTAVMLSVEAT